jgi:TAT-translocated FGD2 family F420-dependent dehydrogenase
MQDAEEVSNQRLISRRSALGTMAAGAGALLITPSAALGAAPEAKTFEVPQQAASGPLGKIGFFLSHEQFPAPQLAQFGMQAETAGFDNLWTSDHIQPWQDNQGHAGYARVTQAVLGQMTKRVGISSYVTCPIFRYNPAYVAQSLATLAQFTPGRVLLCVGTGEALNETAATGNWGNYAERAARLIEAVTLIRQLWTGQTVDFNGKYFQTKQLRLYDPPPQPIPLYIAATGPKSMYLAGQYGDGLVTDNVDYYKQNKGQFEAGARAAGKDPAKMPVICSTTVVVGDTNEALPGAELWRFTPQEWGAFVNNYNPVWIHQQADALIPIQDVYKNWAISLDPQDHVKAIKKLYDAGVTHVVINSHQADQSKVIDFYGKQVLPLLKS